VCTCAGEQTAALVSAVVASAVATAVASAVAGTVAGSVAGAVGGGVAGGAGGGAGGAGGAGGGGGGGGGVVALIDQVQFMTIVGTVGGSSASPGNAAFSKGFGWANFDLVSIPGGSDSYSTRRASPQGCADPENRIGKFMSRVVICVGVVAWIFYVRTLVRAFSIKMSPDAPPPPDLAFPAWEGLRLLLMPLCVLLCFI